MEVDWALPEEDVDWTLSNNYLSIYPVGIVVEVFFQSTVNYLVVLLGLFLKSSLQSTVNYLEVLLGLFLKSSL